jgi:Fe-S cluster assembly iron-binding protein IscA
MQQPSIHATDYAVSRIQQVRDHREQPDDGVRIAITGRSNGEFLYALDLVFAGREREGDMGWKVLLPLGLVNVVVTGTMVAVRAS